VGLLNFFVNEQVETCRLYFFLVCTHVFVKPTRKFVLNNQETQILHVNTDIYMYLSLKRVI